MSSKWKVPNRQGQSPKKQLIKKGLAPTSLKHVFIESANPKDHACAATVTSDNAFINVIATTAGSFTGTSAENIPVRSATSNHQVYTTTGTSDNNDNYISAESFTSRNIQICSDIVPSNVLQLKNSTYNTKACSTLDAIINNITPKKYHLREREMSNNYYDDAANDSQGELSELQDSVYEPSIEDLVSLKAWVIPNEMEIILNKFVVYLTSPDGGNRDKVSSAEVMADVKRTCRALCAQDFAPLFNRTILRNQYLMTYCADRKHEPDTIKKYLRSIRDFYEFCVTDNVNVNNVEHDDILNMKVLITHWMASYNKQSRERFWERQEIDYSMLVTPEQVDQYKNSNSAMSAISLFKQLQSIDTNITQAEYTSMRDHLFVLIHFGNGHRSGVTANLMMQEFNAAIQIDDTFQIRVRKHKNFAYCGPAIISLDKKSFAFLSTYVNKIRSQLQCNFENVFLSWTGHFMRSGAISRQINSLWKKAGIFDDKQMPKNLSCNIIRKSASTGIRESSTGLYQEAADLMAHHLNTAESHYHLRNKSHSAAKASNVIGSFFNVNSQNNVTQEECTPPQSPLSPRKKWDVNEICTLQDVFKDEILSKSVDLDVVRRNKDRISLINATEKQVLDKVRNLYRYTPERNKHSNPVAVSFISFKIHLKSFLHLKSLLHLEIIYYLCLNFVWFFTAALFICNTVCI